MLTIDASVWVNSFLPTESGHAESRLLLDRVESAGIPIVLPTLVLVEVAGTLSRVRSMPAAGLSLAQSIATLSSVRLVSVDEDLCTLAATIAANRKLRGADAVYSAVASNYNCTLISLDNEHLTRLQGLVTVWNPATALRSL